MSAIEYLRALQEQQRDELNFPPLPPRRQPSSVELRKAGAPPEFVSFLTEVGYHNGADVQLKSALLVSGNLDVFIEVFIVCFREISAIMHAPAFLALFC